MLNTEGVYPSQAHEFYHQLKSKVSTGDPGQAFMYWGKIQVNQKSTNHLEIAQSVVAQNKSNGEDTYLYITDYHHFWIAKIEAVQKELFNPDLTLPFYDNKDVELWFKISDMDLLSAEFEETSCYLKQLYIDNDFSEQKVETMNPYVGGLNFPAVIQDRTDEKYFQNVFVEDGMRVKRRNALIENPKFSDDISSQMKSFVLPPHVYSRLSNTVKSELLAVETSLAQEDSTSENFTYSMVHSYLRILESLMSDTLGKVLKNNFGKSLYISHDGEKLYDHKTDENIKLNDFHQIISLGAFTAFLKDISSFGNLSMKALEETHPILVKYFSEELAPFLLENEIPTTRLRLKNGDKISFSKAQAFAIRNEILGVGCIGVMNQLIKLTALDDQEEKLQNIA